MKRAVALGVVGIVAIVAVAVGTRGGAAGSSPLRPTYYQDVKPIFEGRCTGCHVAGGIAPFVLTSYETARRNRKAIAAAVGSRTMPPWHAETGHRRYLYDPSLTTAQSP